MAYVALIFWFTTMLVGLYMFTIWLIEIDLTDPNASATRLPVAVVVSHMLLVLTGLAVWVFFLILGRPVLAWVAVAILGMIAVLGFAMFARWIPVYREPVVTSGTHPLRPHAAPPESAFPVAVVIGHGLLAVSTLVLVLLTALSKSGV